MNKDRTLSCRLDVDADLEFSEIDLLAKSDRARHVRRLGLREHDHDFDRLPDADGVGNVRDNGYTTEGDVLRDSQYFGYGGLGAIEEIELALGFNAGSFF